MKFCTFLAFAIASASAIEVDLVALQLAGKVTEAKTGGGNDSSNPCGCEERRIEIDFNDLQAGAYVDSLAGGNLRVSVSTAAPDFDGGSSGTAARVFDSSDPRPNFYLGSPNRSCGGTGNGDGGAVGARGDPRGRSLLRGQGLRHVCVALQHRLRARARQLRR